MAQTVKAPLPKITNRAKIRATATPRNTEIQKECRTVGSKTFENG